VCGSNKKPPEPKDFSKDSGGNYLGHLENVGLIFGKVAILKEDFSSGEVGTSNLLPLSHSLVVVDKDIGLIHHSLKTRPSHLLNKAVDITLELQILHGKPLRKCVKRTETTPNLSPSLSFGEATRDCLEVGQQKNPPSPVKDLEGLLRTVR
jgi:hypothetical protein